MNKNILQVCLIFLCVAFVVACQPKIPEDALKFTPETLEQRQIQTKYFDTADEAEIITACAALLQDLGFNLDESETKLGVIVSSKQRSAVQAAQVVGSVILAILTGAVMPVDTDQLMRACVVTRAVGEEQKRIAVRVTFQRLVRNTQGRYTTREGIRDPKIYQEFFTKLSKSVFLEANDI